MRGVLRIDEVFVFIVIDSDGTEGIPAFVGPGGMLMPMIAADASRLANLRPMAEQESKRLGVPFKLVRFSKREELETFGTITPDKVV